MTRVAGGPDWFTNRLEYHGRQGGGMERPNTQPAGIRKKKQYTLPGGQGQAVTLLSPSPANQNNQTVHQSTVGYGGEGGR